MTLCQYLLFHTIDLYCLFSTSVDSLPIQSNEQKPRRSGFWSELIRFALIAVVIVLPIRTFVAQPFIVSGSSMEETFLNADYLIIDEISYRFEDPQRGDVVIFRYPKNPSKFFIKRIIGLPDEEIHIADNTVTIANTLHPEGFVLDEPYISAVTTGNTSLKLASDEYFVMGDNRPSSSDSRIWGPLQQEFIVGRALVRLYPPTKIAMFPGAYVHTDTEKQPQSPEIAE